MYSLDPTPGYREDLRRLEANTGSLTERLSNGLYRLLERDPRQGYHNQRLDVWFARQRVIPGLLLVQVVYQIDEEQRRIELIAVEVVDDL